MALRLSQEEFTRGVQTYSRDMYRAARARTPCDAAAQDAGGQAVLLAWPWTGCGIPKPCGRGW